MTDRKIYRLMNTRRLYGDTQRNNNDKTRIYIDKENAINNIL